MPVILAWLLGQVLLHGERKVAEGDLFSALPVKLSEDGSHCAKLGNALLCQLLDSLQESGLTSLVLGLVGRNQLT